MLDMEATFAYIGDMLCSGGGCNSAIAASCFVAWEKFTKLLPVLTSRHFSPRICGKVHEAPRQRNNCYSRVYHMWHAKECVVNFHSVDLRALFGNSHLSVSIFILLGPGSVLVPGHQLHQ